MAKHEAPPRWLAHAAQVASETGTTVTIERGGSVYRITPDVQLGPITANEKDKAACDEAFGL